MTDRKYTVVAALLASIVLDVSSAGAAPKHVLSPHHMSRVTANLHPVGRLAGGTELELEIGLPLRNAEQIGPLLQQIYDPASTNYHHYLTPQQFIERFGPAPADYEAVKHYVQAHGLTVTKTFPDNELLAVRGPVTNIESAFHLHLLAYPHPNEPRNFFTPDAEPALDLDVPVLDIAGLDNFVVPHPMSLHRSSPGTSPKPNVFTGSGPNGNFIGNDFRAAYAPNVSLNGAGQAVALVEFDGYYLADITAYESKAKLPNVPLTNILTGFSGVPGADNGEVALDIQMVVSMAPGLSNVMVYESSVSELNIMLNQIATDDKAMQISSSWTFPVSSITTNIFAKFGLQGQTFFNASGDSGAYIGSPVPPTDDPFITIVGGTTLSNQSAGGPWYSEKVWNWYTDGSGTNGSGGGISSILIPTWQQGVSMFFNQGSTFYRNLPDVALTADNIFSISDNGSFAGEVGGTSAAAPLWAGFAALANQQAELAGSTNIGFINPTVYAVGKGTNYTNVFHDITTGNNTNAQTSSKYSAVTGYDLCTGWGTPNGANMISALTRGSPVITNQPASEAVYSGYSLTFNVGVVALGNPPAYQWKFNGTNISQATNSSYTIPNLQATNEGIYTVVVSNSSGSVTTSNAMLTVIAPPTITSQPQSLSVLQGSSATFTVATIGSPPPTYRWQFNGANIVGATSNSYTVTNAQLKNQGNYRVVIANTQGSVTSSNAVLTVNSSNNAPPTITIQPQSLSLLPGTNAAFSVTATGSTPLTYQWLFNSNVLSDNGHITGSQTTNLLITNLINSDAGYYLVTVSNAFGTATSSNVALNLLGVPVAFVASPGALQYNNGQFTLHLTNLTGQGPIVIQTSTNLMVWTSIYTNPPGYGGFQFTDTNAANFPANFYRVIVP